MGAAGTLLALTRASSTRAACTGWRLGTYRYDKAVEQVRGIWSASPQARRIVAPDLSQLGATVPSLIRFIVTLAILAGLAYAGMVALATFVEPTQREMTTRIPSDRLNP